MQNRTTILVLIGLAIVAAAAIAGLTRDRWMADVPPVQTAAPEQPPATTAEQPAATTAEQPAATTAEQPAATTAEQPAATTAEQPAATTAEQPAATTAEQPAATTAEQPAATTAEQPAATTAEQPAATTAEQPAATTAEQPAANATKQTTVGTAVEQTPAFDTVRVEMTGEAVIAGTAAPGSEVTALLDGQSIGTAKANDDGAFVIVPDKPLPEGSGALTLEARSPGQMTVTTSKQSVAVIVPAGGQQQALVAVVSPDQPTKVIQKPAAPASQPARLVSIDAVDYDSTGNIVFSGQGDQGHTARIYVDNAMVGDAPVGADGHWSFSATADIPTGNHILRVDGLDAEGKVVNRVEVPFFREAQNKVADAQQPAAEAAQPEAAESSAQTTPAESTSDASAPVPREGRIVIQPGNNLWRISRVLYGSGADYTVLYNANKDQIRNPNLIYPGQVFKTPDVAPKLETIDPNRREPLKPDENAATGQ